MSTDITKFNDELKRYVQQGYHLPGVTVITEIADFMRPSLWTVQIDSDITHGEVYPVGGGKLGLGRGAISKFTNAGRIKLTIPPGGTRVIKGNGTESYVAKIKGSRYEIDGFPKEIEEEKVYDLIAREAELRLKYEKKAQENKNWTDAQKKAYVDKALYEVMVEKRKFAMESAITGAQARVVEKLLGIKPAYTREELKKPFVIVSVVPVVDLKDPSIKKMVTAQMLGITDTLFQTAAGLDYSHQYVQALPPAQEVVPEITVSTAASLPGRMSVEDFEAYPRNLQEGILRQMFGDANPPAFTGMSDEKLVDMYRNMTGKETVV